MTAPRVYVSHADEDKPFVERYAKAIAAEIGEDRVFYDAWSNQPGDSIPGNINEALGRCTHFFLFMTDESLDRPWVQAEWHAAFIRRLLKQVRLIPVRIDDCQPPPLLLTLYYIDAATDGPEVAEEQILNAVAGKQAFRPADDLPNLTGRVHGHRVTISVAKYPLQDARFAILFDGPGADILIPIEPCNGQSTTYQASDGTTASAVIVEPFRVVTASRPFEVIVGPGRIIGCKLAVGAQPWDDIPLEFDEVS